jgi:UDP-N-acetylmuramate: L-alanyl-gamma-D-glutamyl-meso-diaminopimelate ligase
MADLISQLAGKQRVLFTGRRHGATFASIVAHVLKFNNRKFDLIMEGDIVEFTPETPLSLIVSSEKKGIDGIAEFRKYDHHIGVITEIEFEGGNNWQDEDEYIRQYDLFADATPKAGLLAYCELDPVASVLCNKERADVTYLPYKPHSFIETDGLKYLINSHKDKIQVNFKEKDSLKWFGGAKELVKKLGITSEQFYQAIPSFLPS